VKEIDRKKRKKTIQIKEEKKNGKIKKKRIKR
jgi:hypothetical protein